MIELGEKLIELAPEPMAKAFFVNSGSEAIDTAIRPETRQLWIETPSNPLLTVTDITAASEVAHARGVQVVVDNTFASPYLQRPLETGADIVMHSATKYLNGHSDMVGGGVVVDIGPTIFLTAIGTSQPAYSS